MIKLILCWLAGISLIQSPKEIVKTVLTDQIRENYKAVGSVLASSWKTYAAMFAGMLLEEMGAIDYLSKELKKRSQKVFDAIPKSWMPFIDKDKKDEKPKKEVIDVKLNDDSIKKVEEHFFSPITFIVALNFLLVAIYLFGKLFFQPFKFIVKKIFKKIRGF